MNIELRGIVQAYDSGHKYVDVVVKEGTAARAVKHRMGVDIDVNRGKILTFLAEQYSVPAGQIVWPDHITVKVGDD